MTREVWVTAADRNSGSMPGLLRFSRAPFVTRTLFFLTNR